MTIEAVRTVVQCVMNTNEIFLTILAWFFMPLLIDTFAENTNFSRKLNFNNVTQVCYILGKFFFKINFSSKKIQLNFPGGGCFITFCWPDTNNAWQFFSKPFFHNYVLQVQSVFLKVHVFLLLYKKIHKNVLQTHFWSIVYRMTFICVLT